MHKKKVISVETSHIAYAYNWFSGVLLAGGWLGPRFCMINGPVPGEDLEKNQGRHQGHSFIFATIRPVLASKGKRNTDDWSAAFLCWDKVFTVPNGLSNSTRGFILLAVYDTDRLGFMGGTRRYHGGPSQFSKGRITVLGRRSGNDINSTASLNISIALAPQINLHRSWASQVKPGMAKLCQTTTKLKREEACTESSVGAIVTVTTIKRRQWKVGQGRAKERCNIPIG